MVECNVLCLPALLFLGFGIFFVMYKIQDSPKKIKNYNPTFDLSFILFFYILLQMSCSISIIIPWIVICSIIGFIFYNKLIK